MFLILIFSTVFIFKVPGETTSQAVTGLKAFTVYNATVIASNKHGNSLPS